MRFQLHHLLPFALLWLGCGAETTASEAPPVEAEVLVQEQSMLELSDRQGLLASAAGASVAGGIEREQVAGDIYHYSFRLQVGAGAHDVVTLHRVVREKAPWRPARSPESVFMVHGDAWNFTGAFMASTLTQDVPVNHSLAVYLAERGVDVWGIDLRWTHVPLETQDFSFMKAWNMGTHVEDMGTGLAVARQVRRLTGSGGGRMDLLGWSRGAMLGYAYLNGETQLPAGQRHVKGFIPVDMVLHFGEDGAQQREWACTRAALLEQAKELGQVEGGLLGPGAGVAVMMLGQAAIYMPSGIAMPPMPPLPYGQLATLMGAATFQFTSMPALGVHPAVPFYHFTAGDFSAGPLPSGLQYVKSRQFFDLLSHARPYQSFAEVVEGEQLLCGQKELPYDDHLAEVKVPVMYVGAGGGFGSYGLHSMNLLGSKDKSSLVVQRMPTEARVADYGHADLFLASDAASAVWAPIHEWMKAH
ncbi:MAG TPA: hypothetical protein VF794_35895 [Archangium sp.]|jgi:hypothetical protein|uniref:hypothetical protein n=1 Tax=Archangium sp. TaxID=1872627 RepID=UPI002EDA5376